MQGTATRTDSLLRPREIQVRIRSGQTPETVAAAAQTTVERVMVFATPVLAERAFVAQQAIKASVRRRGGDGPVGSLGDAVSRRLESLGLDPDAAEWDAWRREDGRWTVVADWREDGEDRQAEFTYDAMGRYVVAEDDPARWLIGERRAPEPARAPEEVPDAAGQLALGDDALQVVTGRPVAALRAVAPAASPAEPDHEPDRRPWQVAAAEGAVRADAEPTEDLSETARAVRAVGDRAPTDALTSRPTTAPTTATATAPATAPATDGDGLFEDAELRKPPPSTPDRRPARAASGPRARRSMPSWDDIMLGSAPRGD
jgi:hypothetical protein